MRATCIHFAILLAYLTTFPCHADDPTNWPAFRGRGGRGVAEGFSLRTEWNADPQAKSQHGVKWQTPIPGLGHSSPVIFGNQLFLLTAVAKAGPAELKVGAGGEPTAAKDDGEQSWLVLCYDKNTGRQLWQQEVHQGRPRATRHAKATHANTSVSVDGKNVVAFLGSEGLYCFDMTGELRWKRDLGVINISKYGIGWGFSSSPAIHQDRIALVCDDPQNPYVVMVRLDNGQDVWRASRKEICERSWGTPYIHSDTHGTQVVVNGWPWIVAYDFETGNEVWRIRGGGDNPIPTPFEALGNIFITNAHGPESPIFVVRPDARGNLTDEHSKSGGIVWSVQRGGSYMSTPVVYGDYLYLGNSNGAVRCFNAQSGEKMFEQRLGSDASIIASLVAGDGKLFCASENGMVYVLAAGQDFQILASNPMGEPCFATPAISEGVLFIRTTNRLVAIQSAM
jgi:outer membrane protein assembly factor BamB